MTTAQTVVVTPLSRSGFQPVSPLPTDGSDRAALAQRLAQLEREAKRLKRILGIREPEVAMVTEAEGGGPSDVSAVEVQNGNSVSCEQNAERLIATSSEELSVCQVKLKCFLKEFKDKSNLFAFHNTHCFTSSFTEKSVSQCGNTLQ